MGKAIEQITRDKVPWWEEYLLWPLERAWKWFPNKLRELKWFIQRGKQGFADCDVWSLDGYLLSWLPQAIRELRDTTYGYPTKLGEKHKKNGFVEWKKTLTKMANNLDTGNEILDLTYRGRKKFARLDKEFKEGLKSLSKHFFSLWD